VKYAPALGLYEDLDAAALRFQKHARIATRQTLLVRPGRRLPAERRCRASCCVETARPARDDLAVAVRINPFRTEEYEKDLAMVRDLAEAHRRG